MQKLMVGTLGAAKVSSFVAVCCMFTGHRDVSSVALAIAALLLTVTITTCVWVMRKEATQ